MLLVKSHFMTSQVALKEVSGMCFDIVAREREIIERRDC